MNHTLPYSEIFYPLLSGVHNALLECYTLNKTDTLETISVDSKKKITDHFSRFEKFYPSGINKHITTGLSKTHQSRHKMSPRLTNLTLQCYREAQIITRNANFKGIIVPSPLYILYQALTIPFEQQSAAYSQLLCRSMLFHFMKLHPESRELSAHDEYFSCFQESDIIDSLSSFRKYVKIQARWPDQRENRSVTGLSTRINFLVGHYLSMKGFSYLWFNSEESLRNFLLCGDPELSHSEIARKYREPEYRFRISELHIDLPEHGEVINSMFGIPLPIRGGDILFHGGLKTTSAGGAVVNLSGKPGVGKTSIALSIAALLSPFGTKSMYISLEEEPEDLYKRLLTLIPEYIKELSFYLKPGGIDSTDWFSVFKIDDNLTFKKLGEIISLMKAKIDEQNNESDSRVSIPATCPLYVVIDNINQLAAGYKDDMESYSALEEFIISCRKLGALVLLISSEDVPEKINLSYLVDISIHTKQTGTESNLIKPIRIFQLNKTRNQVSRQGSHIFHLSGSEGFRISIQIPSLTDKKENLKKLLADKTKCIPTLNILEQKDEVHYIQYLKIFPYSQILIHGQGSSGKAGLALKILSTPAITRIRDFNKITNQKDDNFIEKELMGAKFSNTYYQRKILIISFLYPKEYYEELISNKVIPSLRRINKSIQPPRFKSLAFFPGYLTAEDFVNKIVRALDEAILEGEPFTGVLLDGLHNVFLQFKNLQDNDMVWPLLYGILSKYKVTVVSTFTNFRISNQLDADYGSLMIEDQKLMQKGQTPLLHTMVKACDFYISLDELIEANLDRSYQISIHSAMDQTPPKNSLIWDRISLSVVDFKS